MTSAATSRSGPETGAPRSSRRTRVRTGRRRRLAMRALLDLPMPSPVIFTMRRGIRAPSRGVCTAFRPITIFPSSFRPRPVERLSSPMQAGMDSVESLPRTTSAKVAQTWRASLGSIWPCSPGPDQRRRPGSISTVRTGSVPTAFRSQPHRPRSSTRLFGTSLRTWRLMVISPREAARSGRALRGTRQGATRRPATTGRGSPVVWRVDRRGATRSPQSAPSTSTTAMTRALDSTACRSRPLSAVAELGAVDDVVVTSLDEAYGGVAFADVGHG